MRPAFDSRLLVLDIDGVLIEAGRSFMDAVHGAVLELAPGLPWSDEHFTAFKRAGGFNNDFRLAAAALALFQEKGPLDLLPMLLQAEGKGLPELEARVDELEPLCKEAVQRHYERTRFQEVALVTLEELRAPGYELAILTGRPPEEWLLARDVLGFDLPAITDSEPRWRKPSPDGLLHWAKHFGARNIVFAGDTLDDANCLRAARALMPELNWTFAAIGPDRDRIRQEGDFAAETLRELLAVLSVDQKQASPR